AGSDAAHRSFLAVQRAYTMLRNPDWRAAYDHYLEHGYSDVEMEPREAQADEVETRWQRFRRAAKRATIVTMALAVFFVAGTLLWHHAFETLPGHQTPVTSLVSANATNAHVSPEQLAEALYGSEAALYSSDARLQRDMVPPAPEHVLPPSMDPIGVAEAALRQDA